MGIYCIVCGKPVRASARMVHMRTDNKVFSEDFDHKIGPGNDQGWFEIGPDCLRKVQDAGAQGLILTQRSMK